MFVEIYDCQDSAVLTIKNLTIVTKESFICTIIIK